MPVLSRSLPSSSAIHFLASAIEALSSSSSSDQPSLIRPPSLTVSGGSSVMAPVMLSYMSVSGSMSVSIFESISVSIPSRSYLMSGSTKMESLRAIRSLAFALPLATLPARRSKSYIGLMLSLRLFLSIGSLTRYSTPSSLSLMACDLFRGSLSHCFIRRDPIAVPVLSRTPRREPLTVFSNIVLVISRFLIVDLSRAM